MSYNLYWGDIHNHCSISYGHGTLEQALARARQQLDFCSVTGHAFWPDMPTDRDHYAEIIDYHNVGFARLARNWNQLVAAHAKATEPSRFVAFPSYEWHSLRYGDHVMYAKGPELPLRDAPDLPAFRKLAAEIGAIVVPHHIGYSAGYRGIAWDDFRDERSPMVEIFSLHGCSESTEAPYPMLHDMGPRDDASTAEAGWRRGYRFGVIASSDHHGAYPGSHGDGRLGVFATELTRDAIWEGWLARRVFAATGDKIDARLWVDDAWIGESITAPGTRQVRVAVRGIDALDRVEVLKNGRVLRRVFPTPASGPATGKCRLRVTWGWGRKDVLIPWTAKLTLDGGTIERVDTCFAGAAVVAPQSPDDLAETPDDTDLPHEMIERSDTSCSWRSITHGNLTMRHATTQALSLEVDLRPGAKVTVEVNGHRFTHAADELLHAARSHYLRGWLSEAIQIGPLVPETDCMVETSFTDEPELDFDVYRLRASQRNGHWVWLTPVWAERK